MLYLENAPQKFCQSNALQKLLNSFLSKIQSFHEKSHFYSHYKRFWVLENSKSAIERLDQINTENTKLISTFEFSTLYAKLTHKDQLKVLFDLIDFGFNGGSKKKIDFSLPNAFWSNKPKTESFFT